MDHQEAILMLNRIRQEPAPTEETVSAFEIQDGSGALETDAPSAAETGENQAAQEEIDSYLLALQLAVSLRTKTVSRVVPGAGILFVFMILMNPYREFIWPIFWMSVLSVGSAATLLAHRESVVREAVNALANTEDLRAIGPLAERLSLWKPSPRATAALCRLLPRLQSSDAELLNERQRASLRKALRQNANRLLFWRDDPLFADVLRHALTTLDALPLSERAVEAEEAVPLSSPVEGLLKLFQGAIRQRRKNTVTMGAAAALSATCAVANLFTQMHPLPNHYLIQSAVISLVVTFALSFRGLFRLKRIMHELADVSDLRIAGPLLEIAALEDGSAKTIPCLLLTQLLPRFRASDAKLLTETQHAALLRMLGRNDTAPEFFVAALKALEQVGDARALPVVENLALGRRFTADQRRVQAAAGDCLPYLRIRCDQQRASQTLLRASSASGAPVDTLLRPARGVGATDTSELLRASASQTDSP
jgi:hypothetical protein